MSKQIAVRIPTKDLTAVDLAVADGRFESRAAAVREGLDQLLRGIRESEIAVVYEQAYAGDPKDEQIGEAGAHLAAEVVREDGESRA